MSTTITEIEKNVEKEILEFFIDQGCAAITTYNLSCEIAESVEDTLNALYRLHTIGALWTHGKQLWKPFSDPKVVLAELEAEN